MLRARWPHTRTGRGRHVPACPRHTDPALFRCAQLGQRLARLRGGPPPPSPGSRKPPSCPLAQRPPQTLSSDGAPQAGAPRAGQKPRPGVRAPGGGASGDGAEEQLSPRQTKATRNYSSRPPDTEINESDNPGSGRSAPCGRGLPSTCAQRSRSLRGQWPRSPLRPGPESERPAPTPASRSRRTLEGTAAPDPGLCLRSRLPRWAGLLCRPR